MGPTLLLSLILFLFPPPPPAAAAGLRATSNLFRSQFISSPTDTPPTTFFEVTKPIPLPNTTPCSSLLLRHDFGYTYGRPPVTASYTPPSHCPSQTFDKIVLEWSASCKGRQFDRIFGVWLGGVELLRSCTAEPTAAGIVWKVKKDVTRYRSLFMAGNQTLAVYLGNLVTAVYTGVYHVNITLHFYPAEVPIYSHSKLGKKLGFDIGADLILPISRNLPLKDGLWFEIQNSTQIVSKQVQIPLNSYKAVLEVYVSFHENDEFYYENLPNEYNIANNITGLSNGPFREVVVTLDDELVAGAIWPFTVIYTGGVNPLLWRPITGIGSFDLPSYNIEITPFLGRLLDGKSHTFAFSVTNALNVWYVDANLHLWKDEKSYKTSGKLLEHMSSPLALSQLSNFTGLDGSFTTTASRLIVSVGWVNSSHGMITTRSSNELTYSNTMVISDNGNSQDLNQAIYWNASVDTKTPSSSPARSTKSFKKFTIACLSKDVEKGIGMYEAISNVSLGVDKKWERASRSSGVISSHGKLKNVQKGDGYMLVKGNLVQSGIGSTQQEYRYIGDDWTCYYRNVSSSNYTIVHDEESKACKGRGEDWVHRHYYSYLPRRPFLRSA